MLFDGFGLSVPRGGRYLLDAPSGTGKSTLLRLFLGLEDFDAGTVEIEGTLLERKSVRGLRRTIAYLSQDIELAGDRTVSSLFHEILSYDTNRRLAAADIPGILAEWDLPRGAESSPVGNLSGGERQRLGLAILEYLGRSIWILDEPTAALDEERGRMAARRILGVPGRTVLVVSHDPFWKELGLDGVVGIPELEVAG